MLTPLLTLLEINELLETLGILRLAIMGIELQGAIKACVGERLEYSEIVLQVSLIAITRQVIILDIGAHENLPLLGAVALIVVVAGALFAVKHNLGAKHSGPE
jgi:hypothetical protein